jgi:DNA-binding response OmpR family regulator
MNNACRILSISYNESLLRTREWILKGAGFDVTSALGFTEASVYCQDRAFDLAIIGHSIPKKDKDALIQQLRSHNHTRILGLRKPGEEVLASVDHSVEASLGAEALVDAVKTVLNGKLS